MAQDELDLTTLYDEDIARETLENIRWKDGVVCPHCEAREAYRLEAKLDSKKGGRKGLWKCKKCRKQFTVTVGTIFEGSRIPLNKWLFAIHLICSSKKGISAHQLHRMLGLTYKTAWFMAHRIRYAMTQEPFTLTGTVEVDETYVGGKSRNMHKADREKKMQGRGAVGKAPVITLVERNGRVRSQHIENVTGTNLKRALTECVEESACIMSDESPVYFGTKFLFADHQAVNHRKGEYVRGRAHINTAESVHALLKRGIIGTFHHVSKKHLHRYLSEFDFRFNARKVSDNERMLEALKGIEGKRLKYKN